MEKLVYNNNIHRYMRFRVKKVAERTTSNYQVSMVRPSNKSQVPTKTSTFKLFPLMFYQIQKI